MLGGLQADVFSISRNSNQYRNCSNSNTKRQQSSTRSGKNTRHKATPKRQQRRPGHRQASDNATQLHHESEGNLRGRYTQRSRTDCGQHSDSAGARHGLVDPLRLRRTCCRCNTCNEYKKSTLPIRVSLSTETLPSPVLHRPPQLPRRRLPRPAPSRRTRGRSRGAADSCQDGGHTATAAAVPQQATHREASTS
jgi:hypothetical protein